jgi:hypothetical protein
LPRGGKRQNAGRPKVERKQVIADGAHVIWLLEQLNRPAKASDSYEVQQWRVLTEAKDVNVRGMNRRNLYDRVYGKPVQPVAHGGEVEHFHSLSDKLKKARERSSNR